MKTSLEDIDYQLIKAHILTPEQSPLTADQQFQLNRVMSVARVMDKNPVMKHATSIHMAKYPEISRAQAYADAALARRLFNTIHKFDYDFWQTWTINDVIENIRSLRTEGSPASRRVIAMEHANLLKAIGERPEIPNDPRLTDKHEFYFLIRTADRDVKIDMSMVKKLPDSTLAELNHLLFSKEITDIEAEEFINNASNDPGNS